MKNIKIFIKIFLIIVAIVNVLIYSISSYASSGAMFVFYYDTSVTDMLFYVGIVLVPAIVDALLQTILFKKDMTKNWFNVLLAVLNIILATPVILMLVFLGKEYMITMIGIWIIFLIRILSLILSMTIIALRITKQEQSNKSGNTGDVSPC